jgi:hypothetical protein
MSCWYLKRITLSIVGVVGIVLAAVLAFWWNVSTAVSFLPRSSTVTELVELQAEHRNRRILQHICLFDKTLGDINFEISLPDPLPQRKLPLVLVMGGLGTGEHTVRFVEGAGYNAIVGYDWPLPTRRPKNLGIGQLIALHERALSIPGQVSAVLRWSATQSWCDPKRVSVLGFSLGAIIVPAVDRI